MSPSLRLSELRLLALPLLAALAFGAACEREPATAEEGTPARPQPAEAQLAASNVVLVSIDTLRADRLSSYGHEKPTSPTIDALAAKGVRFSNAMAEAPWTLPSHMTLMSGLHPRAHGTNRFGRRLPDDIPTLAETLQGSGYRTFAYTTGGFLGSTYGFGRGFEVYFEQLKPFVGLVDRAIAKIGSLASDERYFLFLQTFDVHCPYQAGPKYRRALVSSPAAHHVETAGKCSKDYAAMDLSPDQTRFLSEMYDAGIRQADDALGKLVRFLESQQLRRRTILILLSDHGEEFGEPGGLGHGHSLYDEALRIPLVIVAPGLEPRVVAERVGLVDVMPTLLDLVDVPAPQLQGRSLVPWITGEPAAPGPSAQPRAHFAETTINHVHLQSIVEEDAKLILDVETDEVELYDLARDPREQENVASSNAERARALRLRLEAHFAPAPRAARAARPDETNLEQLRALGYVE